MVPGTAFSRANRVAARLDVLPGSETPLTVRECRDRFMPALTAMGQWGIDDCGPLAEPQLQQAIRKGPAANWRGNFYAIRISIFSALPSSKALPGSTTIPMRRRRPCSRGAKAGGAAKDVNPVTVAGLVPMKKQNSSESDEPARSDPTPKESSVLKPRTPPAAKGKRS